MIGHDPEWFLRETVRRWSGTATPVDEAAIREYVRWFSRPEAIHATCEDYRAGASIDLEHDAEDAGRRVSCPLLALWGEEGRMGRTTTCWRPGRPSPTTCAAGDARRPLRPRGGAAETVAELTARLGEGVDSRVTGGSPWSRAARDRLQRPLRRHRAARRSPSTCSASLPTPGRNPDDIA